MVVYCLDYFIGWCMLLKEGLGTLIALRHSNILNHGFDVLTRLQLQCLYVFNRDRH